MFLLSCVIEFTAEVAKVEPKTSDFRRRKETAKATQEASRER